MYGTVYRMRPKPGQEDAVDEMGRRWHRERTQNVEGFVAEYVLKSETHPGEWLGLVIFESKASYRKNAESSEQDQEYRELRALLEEDPEWNDGEIVAVEQATVPL